MFPFNTGIFLIFLILRDLDSKIYENETSVLRELNTKHPPYTRLSMSYYNNTFKYKKHICEILNCSVYPSKGYKFSTKNIAADGLLVNSCEHKNVYFSKIKSGNPLDTWKICCNFGMEPLLIRNRDELECLNNAITSSVSSGDIKPTNSKYTFYTGWLDHFFDRDFRECPGKSKIPNDIWSMNEPNNMGNIEACIIVTFSKSANLVGLADIPCIVSVPVACQIDIDGKDQLKTNSTTHNKKYPENKHISELSTQSPSLGCSRSLSSDCQLKYEEILQKLKNILSLLKLKQSVTL